MSSDNPNPEQAQAKIAQALGRLRGDVMPPITSQAAPRLSDQLSATSGGPTGISAGQRAEPTLGVAANSAGRGPSISIAPAAPSLSAVPAGAGQNAGQGNSDLSASALVSGSGGIGNGAGVNPPVLGPISSQPGSSQSVSNQAGATPSGSLGNNASGSNYFANIKLDSAGGQPDLLSGVDLTPPPLGNEYPRADDDDARRKRNRRMVLVGAVAAIVVIAGFWIGTRHHGDVPVIAADATPEKVKPADQGGLQVPNQNVQVLENMNGQPKAQNGETVLPPPEQPMAPPAPSQGDQAAQGTTAPSATTDSTATQAPAVPSTTTGDQAVQVPAVPTPTVTTGTQTATATPAVPAVPAVPDAGSSAMSATPAVPTTTASAATNAAPAPTAPTATVPAQEPAAKTAAPAVTAGGKMRVQLAAVKSEAAAKTTWAKLQKAHPAQLGNLSLIVEKVDKGTEGIFYRVQAGPLADKATAKTICSALSQQGQACLIAH